MKRRIIQLLGAMHVGDATGHQALLLDSMLNEIGYDSLITAPTIDEPLKDKVLPFDEFDSVYNPEKDILWKHYNVPSYLVDRFTSVKGKKILQFHNVTPPHFFLPYNSELVRLLTPGEEQLKSLAGKCDIVLADSLFNKKTLESLGHRDVTHFPLIFDEDLYIYETNSVLQGAYSGLTMKNILFVGRVAPNKGVDKLIKFFAYYKKYHNNRIRLLIVGKYDDTDPYFRMLIRLVGRLGVEDIVFTGEVTQEELCNYYALADLFISFSEHEGFFMPLLEAFYFGLPVAALSSTAVPETAGKSALLFDTHKVQLIAELINEIFSNNKLRSDMVKNGKKRLKDFSYSTAVKRLREVLRNI